jgi:hypothetical protein
LTKSYTPNNVKPIHKTLDNWFDTWRINVDECGGLFIHFFPSNIYGVENGAFGSL